MIQKLSEVLRGINPDLAWAVRSCELLLLWPQIVDKRAQKHTSPIKIKNQTLYVSTSSPVWAQELSFLKKPLIEKFNGLAGDRVISDIKFRAAN